MIYKKLIEYIKELLLYNSKQMIIKLISLFIFEYLKIMNEFQYLIYDNLYKTINDIKKYYKIYDDQKIFQDILYRFIFINILNKLSHST